MKNQLRKIFAIQAFNSLVGGILFVALPLLMRERNISIVEIGLIYASLPLVFQTFRLIFAILSDLIGRKKFFVLNAFLNFFTPLIYIFAFNPFQFLTGKITEGVKSSALWSVNRASILEGARDKEKELRRLRAISSIFQALAILAFGFLVMLFSFSKILLISSLISLPLFFLSLSLKSKPMEKRRLGKILSLKQKKEKFRKGLILFILLGLSIGGIDSYVLPLFLREKGISESLIGFLLGFQILMQGISTYEILLLGLDFKHLMLLNFAFPVFLFLLSFSPLSLIPFFLLLLGISRGLVNAGNETIISKIVGKYSYGTDIGIIFTGFHFARTLIIAFSGFLILFFGFSSIFLLSSLIFLSFLLLTLKFI